MENVKIIKQENILSNLKKIKKNNKKLCLMVKADAYGHGIKNIVENVGDDVNFFGVFNSDEAFAVRKYNKKVKILITSKNKNNLKKLIENNISLTIDSLNEVIKIEMLCKKFNLVANIHLAINTGMNRIGIKCINDFKEIINYIKSSQFLNLEGVFTHFFDADCKNNNFYKQMKSFYSYVKLIDDKNILVHIGGSFTLNHKIPSFVTMIRVGLFFYGYGNKEYVQLMEIRSFVSKVTFCKKFEYVGYGNKTRLKGNKKIALINIGYADGVPKNYKNGGYFIINNCRCNVIGEICMDCLMVDVTNINVKEGDFAFLPNFKIVSKITKQSIYETLTNFISFRGKIIVKKNLS